MANFTRKALLFFCLVLIGNYARALTAGFTADYTSGCAPLVVHFTNTSSGATDYSWDLGNGTTTTLTDPSGSYLTAGTYTVTLTASSGSSSSTQTLVITVYPSPTVSFTATDTSVCPGSSVTFTSTSDPGVPGTVTYIWNFGDGFSGSGASATHVYTTPGYYNVTLVVTNSQGCTSSLTLGAYVHIFDPPVASFSALPSYFCHSPGIATFSSTVTGAAPYTYSWTFGDGGSSALDDPTHTYSSSGSYTVVLHVTDANGCVDSVVRSNYIYVGHLAASFTYPSTACAFSPVIFHNTSTPHISSSWSYGDGGTSSADSGVHAYSAPGTYNITLIVFDGYCYDTITHSITILPQPTGSFTVSPSIPCPPPATETFSAATSATSVTWYYGDGSSGTSSSHTYAVPGIDSVKMVITDANGCKDTIIKVDTIFAMNIHFDDTPTHGCVPLTVDFHIVVQDQFGDPYPSPITSYSWTFGDGATSTSSAPIHTYTATGVYTIICSIATANGCSKSDTTIIAVGTPPTITATAAPMHICYHHPVLFTATVVSGPVDVYTWDFGDGSTTVDSNNIVSHMFTHPGYFIVTVFGTYHGCPGPTFTFADTIIVDSPMANMNIHFDCQPYTKVTFHDASWGDDTHEWFFGDGYTSTLDSPTHTYAAETIYTVTLTTYNAHSGCRDTITAVLNLVPPVPVMHASDTAICPSDTVHFWPTVTGGTASEYWWYINGAIKDNDTAAGFYYIFNNRGLDTVRLIIRDQNGCSDTLNRNNYVIVGKPIDTFTVSPPIGCAPLHGTFTDLSTDVPGAFVTSYYWSFGDGGTTTSTTTPVTHTYTTAGSFTVEEIVTDNIGCKDTLSRPNVISAWHPSATFTASTTHPCIGANVIFNNTTTGIVNSFWIFGDGDTTSATSPTHSYGAVGSYTVKLVVWDAHGCTDTATYAGYINVTKPHASFYMDDSFSICPPLSVHFFNTSTGASSYAWNFGDGGTSVSVSPGDLYTTAGLYTITLVATNAYGCKDTAHGTANLYGYAGGFNYTPDSGCAPLTVHFSADITNVPNIIWDYADGTTSAASSLDSSVHTYTSPGKYVPKLILSDNTGCQNSSLGTDTIRVDGVTRGFTTNPHPVCVNSNVSFDDTSTSYFSTIDSWHWIMPDGTSDTIASPSYYFGTVGSFPVSITIMDGWGCTSSITENVVVNPPPVVTTSPDTTVCVGDPASLTGYGAVTYTWAPPATLSCTACTTTQATPTIITTYTVTGTDANGCVNTDTVRVSLRTNTISGAWGDTAVCQGLAVPLFDTGGTKYTWVPGTGLTSSSIPDPIATPSVTTQYMAIAQLAGCIPDTNYVTVVVFPLPTVDAGPDQSLLAGQTAQLQATGTLIQRYLWSPGMNLNCDTCDNPIASMGATTSYTVVVTTEHGCKASDTVTIFIHCDDSQVFMPNSFTPNGDGQNDVFYPRGAGVSIVHTFRIYNRWGELLFERNNINLNDASNGWDGSFNGSSPRPDVYVWMLDAVCTNGQPINIKGDVTIIR